jgi:hypothetical protein
VHSWTESASRRRPDRAGSAAIPDVLPRVPNPDRIDRKFGDLVTARDRLGTVIAEANANANADWRTGRRCRSR